jgi:oligopeptidase B
MESKTILNVPVARREPTTTQIHGHTLRDDYAWLRNKESAEVVAYLEAENAYTDAVMRPAQPLAETLYAEMLSHIQQTDVSVPYFRRGYWYYSRIVEGQQYPLYCRIPAPAGSSPSGSSVDTLPPLPPPQGFAHEQVLLDVNQLAAGQAFMALGAFAVSDDGHRLAYTTDNTGFRQYTLFIRDLRSGETTAALAERTGSIEWAADNLSLFYTIEDEETKRQHQLYRLDADAPQPQSVLLFEEPDERFNIAINRTRDGEYLLLEVASHTTSEIRFLSAHQPGASFQIIEDRRDAIEYYADHCQGHWYIRANDTGRNFRLVIAPVTACRRENWREILPHRADVMLEDLDLFRSFFVVTERVQGLPHLRIFHRASNQPVQEIVFPEPAYRAAADINAEFDATTYRYSYQSLVTPASVYQYDVASATSTLLKQAVVPGGFDRSLYASERIFAPAQDGVLVPVSLVYRKDKFSRGKNPLYVYGYGSYGYSLPIGFNSNRLSLLDRGLVLAYAHIRGGGEMGKPWHDAGRLMEKQNTFSDFIAATEHLLHQGYGARGQVAIEGGSAGGLLMGAVVNQRPDLFRVVLSHVPFVDVMNTMLDASLPLTVPEYEEWGNPNEKAAFECMLAYSPYDNLRAQAYPAMLVKTSLHDSQVMYWEPAKYVARLRTLKQDENLLLLQTNMAAGHGGASGRYDYLKEIALDYAFLLWQLGVEQIG